MITPARPSTDRLSTLSRTQILRDPWPAFETFEADRYPRALRERTARQWWRRAREEYGSIHEFTALSHVLCEVRAPIDLLGGLSRLITDEVRHAELCATMARALLPDVAAETVYDWAPPKAPWPTPPLEGGDRMALTRWAADVVLCACCLGETLSRPLYEALATVTTDPVPEAVVRQILRDEHLHATFGWEALTFLLTELDEPSIEYLQKRLSKRLAGFEHTCTPEGKSIEAFAGTEVVIEPPGPDASPNLGLLDPEVYATIFYATLESEILPRFDELGFDAMRAWQERGRR